MPLLAKTNGANGNIQNFTIQRQVPRNDLYNNDKGEYNTLTPFCICIMGRALLHKQNRERHIPLSFLRMKIFQILFRDKVKMRQYICEKATGWLSLVANIKHIFEYNAPVGCFFYYILKSLASQRGKITLFLIMAACLLRG